MMRKSGTIAFIAVLSLAMIAGVSVLAQPPAPATAPAMPNSTIPEMKMTPPTSGMAMPAMPGMRMSQADAEATPSSKAFKAADDKMMQGMGALKTGDADQDFVTGMLPHHQGAVDMAMAELKYGKDPELRRLATGIINAQKKEIVRMIAWQKLHPVAH